MIQKLDKGKPAAQQGNKEEDQSPEKVPIKMDFYPRNFVSQPNYKVLLENLCLISVLFKDMVASFIDKGLEHIWMAYLIPYD